ncbi:5-methyltetrahydropteroyltriglutamate--homocysteine methyltransferase [Enhydrobacter aerosaccus]|uniref:5-methyltetrahydropteroyltriglutamate--homocysteine methyltransferase n=1 Tax=Enhydrobacter aerosaccus TaxID=225324 RepID=A0A1T4T561_9HYPH|nr:5-methyltetrahydropteroyltriglutamate--homocysteine S-methyltransferase [Enhydrobacter aerosaccus]SKA35670.1 5-methyltetrahydropteroyltriglutamate--homocysteine methyltransferase [Enhydrobacter aerosaccus]
MMRDKPPFRADQVGSLLRTAPLKEARTRRATGEITPAELKAIEDEEIRKLVAKQEAIGLQGITDGEFRRSWWHYDFLRHLDGVELVSVSQGLQFKGTQTKAEGPHVHGRIDFSPSHPMLDHFRFLKSVTRQTPKMTIPSPAALHYRGGRQAIEKSVYPEMDAFFDDLGKAYTKAVRAFGEAGCTYLQLDEVFVAYLCDPAQREYLKSRGDDPDKLLHIYADLINAACAGRTPGMTISMHLCRGNFRSTWMAQGGYEPVADMLFNRMNVDAYFMEYDSERAGGFEPLRFLPRNKHVVLGVMTSKTGALESKDLLKRRIDEASKFAPLDQLCLSPQCGFASTEEGNLLAEEEQWAKLSRCVEVAREVWG